MDLIKRKEALQLELARLQALTGQLDRQRDEVRIRALQITGMLELLGEMAKGMEDGASGPQDPVPTSRD